MPEDIGERTEAPTPRRRQEAREEGNVPKSQDLSAGISLLGAVLLLKFFGLSLFGGMKALMEYALSSAGTADASTPSDVGHALTATYAIAAKLAAPVILGLLLLGVVGALVQVGVLVSPKSLKPNFGRLSPLKGAQQLFSARGSVRLLMSLLKVAIVATIAAITIRGQMDQVMSLMHLSIGAILAASGQMLFVLALRVALVLLVLGIFDYLYQKWQHEQDLKMTKQAAKEEFKRMEGDPLVKQRRSQVARQIAMQRVNTAVPKADVVVTNPTHFAVALEYDESMTAPKVVAKGADLMAMRIRQLAAGHGVPIVERPQLARGLYRQIEVGQEITPDYYAAVAEILAYVYRLSRRQTA